jgi:hypothetical protein
VSVRYSEFSGTGAFGTLLCRSGLEFNYELGGYPAAVFYVDALSLGPLADFGGVQGVRLCFASAAAGRLVLAPIRRPASA